MAELWCAQYATSKGLVVNGVLERPLGGAEHPLMGECRRVLLEAYSNIHDRDGFFGISTLLSDDLDQELMMHTHDKNYSNALQGYNTAALSSGDARQWAPKGLVRTLQAMECSHVVDAYIRSLQLTCSDDYEELREAHYEAALKAGQWDLNHLRGSQSESREVTPSAQI